MMLSLFGVDCFKRATMMAVSCELEDIISGRAVRDYQANPVAIDINLYETASIQENQKS